MDTTVLEILEYHGEGYQPLVDYGDWRVAMLRFLDQLQPDRVDSMERHKDTDEVFVLLQGHGALILGGNNPRVEDIAFQVMEAGKVYNVKQLSWHSILLSRDASVLLVENKDVSVHNSEYMALTEEQRRKILDHPWNGWAAKPHPPG
jgi:hypothetical protein